MENDMMNQEGTQKATGMLIATFIFAALGGWLGIVFGILVWKNKKYIPAHRQLGLVGAILAIVSLVVWRVALS